MKFLIRKSYSTYNLKNKENKMKKIYKSLVFTMATIALTSCVNDWLDLTPSDSIPSNSAITNYNDAKTALYGMYDGLQGNSTYTQYYASRMFYYGDVRGDDMQARTQGMRSSSCYEMKYTIDDAPNMWNVQYNVLRRANRLIEAVENNKITDAEKNQANVNNIYAQAKSVRALVHFDLVKVYGMPYSFDNGASMGVPIVTTPIDPLNASAIPGRNTVAEVYTQIVKDLTESIDSKALNVSKSAGDNQGFIDEWAAKALLTRVYIYMGKNQEALDMAKNIIENSPYSLWTKAQYANAWDKNNANHINEMIFELVNSGSDDWADREGIAYLYHEDGYADAICTKSFVDMLAQDPSDVRLDVILPVQLKTDDNGKPTDMYKTYGDNRIFINKFPMGSLGDMRLNNLPILRLSEVYLNAAEAAAKLNDKTSTAKYLNEIIKNRTDDTKQLVTESTATLERVLLERRKELVGEGQRFFDAMRNNETVTRYTNEDEKGWHYSINKESQVFDRTYFRTILPIPVSETNANPTLKAQQNPGY